MAIITEQNCPSLRFLKWSQPLWKHPEFLKWARNAKGNYTPLPPPFLRTAYVPELVDISERIIGDWENLSDSFRSDIWAVSLAYGKAFQDATDSICKHRVDLYKEMSGETYAGANINMTEREPIVLLYDINLIDIKAEYQEGKGDGFFVRWDGVILMVSGTELLAAACCDPETGKVETSAAPHVEDLFTKMNGSVDAALIFTVMDSLVFRRFANVTVEDAKSKKKKESGVDGDDDQVVVKSNILSDIHRYDVNWYTTTVRTAGFARKGYMAVRWKGHKGKQHPEIVPVKATWVKGYARKAKKPYEPKTLKDFGA